MVVSCMYVFLMEKLSELSLLCIAAIGMRAHQAGMPYCFLIPNLRKHLLVGLRIEQGRKVVSHCL